MQVHKTEQLKDTRNVEKKCCWSFKICVSKDKIKSIQQSFIREIWFSTKNIKLRKEYFRQRRVVLCLVHWDNETAFGALPEIRAIIAFPTLENSTHLTRKNCEM